MLKCWNVSRKDVFDMIGWLYSLHLDSVRKVNMEANAYNEELTGMGESELCADGLLTSSGRVCRTTPAVSAITVRKRPIYTRVYSRHTASQAILTSRSGHRQPSSRTQGTAVSPVGPEVSTGRARNRTSTTNVLRVRVRVYDELAVNNGTSQWV